MPRPVCTQKGRSPQKVKVTHGTAHSTEALRKTKLAFRAFVSFPHIVSRPYMICQQASLLTTGG